MHIAQFVHRYPPALGGAEAYTRRLCEHFADHGDEVRIWTSSARTLEEMWKPDSARTEKIPQDSGSPALGVNRYRPLSLPLRRYVLKALSLVPVRPWQCLTTPCNPVSPRMWADAARFAGPLDAVHATAFPYSFPIACGLRLARRRGVPFFLTPFLHLGDPIDPANGTWRQYTRPHLRWLLHQADGLFVQTRLERDAIVALGVPDRRVFLQGLGVDPAECTGGDRTEARRRWGLLPNEVVVGHLANNSEEKGTCDLLRAMAGLWQRGVAGRVLLAGPEMPNFRSFWQNFAAQDRVVRLGVLSDDEKRDFFAAIDVFGLPSRTDSFGLVLLEAWANGKPNVVYRAGGPAELVRDGIDGLQARCGDTAELTRQLRRLIECESLRRELGKAGQARIGSEFRWEDKLDLVRETIARRVGENRGSRIRPRRHCQILPQG